MFFLSYVIKLVFVWYLLSWDKSDYRAADNSIFSILMGMADLFLFADLRRF